MSAPRYRVRPVDWVDARERLLEVRFAVFVDEQGVPPELEPDAQDASALHLLAEDDRGEAIATARMLPDGRIGRMAVLPPWRGRGVGGQLLRRLIDAARDAGLDGVYLHAQCRALPFYQRFGFNAEGDEFMDAGIPHRSMRLRL